MKRALVLSFAFLSLTLAVAFGSLETFDEIFFSFPSFFAFLLPLFSPSASFVWLLISLLLLLQRRQSPRDAALFFLLFLFLVGVEIILKTVITTDPPALFSPFSFMEGTYPSGHMIRGTLFVALFIHLGFSRLLWLLPLLQALAMLSLLGHTASDLLGGFLLSLAAFSFYQVYLENCLEARITFRKTQGSTDHHRPS